MGRQISHPFKSAIWQVPALVALALLLAFGVNLWRSDGIPFVGDWSADARFSDDAGKSLVISLEDARGLFDRGEILFVDARPESQYDEGHIQGALSLPLQEADAYFMDEADRLSAAKVIVTYCDGESCDLSHDLALFLKEMGMENVRVLVNGWTLWHEAGLPTEGVLRPWPRKIGNNRTRIPNAAPIPSPGSKPPAAAVQGITTTDRRRRTPAALGFWPPSP